MELQELIELHERLSNWHKLRSEEVALDILKEYHADLAERLYVEAGELSKLAEKGKP